MKLKEYIIDKWLTVLLWLLTVTIITLMCFAFKSPSPLIIAIIITITISSIALLLYDYYRKKSFYNQFLAHLNQLDQKYLVIETILPPSFYEGKILVDSLYEINKSMLEKIKTYEQNNIDFKEYIEMWIHEVKLPLATLMLMVHNDSNISDKKIYQQLLKLDNYLEQVLYYVRSENAEKDYLIKENKLKKIISSVALKNKDSLLENKIELIVSDVDYSIQTDSKWMEFILNQIINNSIKYKNKNKAYIKIMAQDETDVIRLAIYDNGIGITKSDLPNVFNKTFTGKNGRIGKKSTGMGLYIAKKLCTKLGHKIEIKSCENEFTMVTITFSKNRYYDVLK